MKCLNCSKGEAIYDRTLGYLNCSHCNQHLVHGSKVEFTTEQIRQDRKKYKDEMMQPFREGQLSKEYIDKYGTEKLKVTKEEVKSAKNVWKSDLEYYR